MKIIRNNIIPFKGFKAINLFGALFVRKSAQIDDVLIRHEEIHTKQIIEITLISLLVTLPFLFKLWWIILLSPLIYYIWYSIEWLIHFIRLKDTNKAYHRISFEEEAYDNQDIDWYLRERKFLNFLKYL